MDRKTIIIHPLLFGLIFGLLINVLQPFILSGTKSYTGSNMVTLVFFSLLSVAFVLLFRSYSKKVKGSLHFSQLILIAIIFSTALATILGLGHYINATFIDPEWGQKALAASQEKWAANNYSEEAIAGQVEWTDTFQNPLKWAISSGIMITFLSSLTGGIIGFIYYVKSRVQNIDVIPQS